MGTMRIDVLKRKILAGKVVAVGSYHYDDFTYDSGHSRHDRVPVFIRPENPSERVPGRFYLLPSEVEKGVRARAGEPREDGSIPVSLHVHSNCNYDLLVLP